MTAVRVAVDDRNYVHVQNSPATAWVINHNLGKYPAVTVVDSAGTEVIGQVVHNSMNQCVATFSAAFAGKAFAN